MCRMRNSMLLLHQSFHLLKMENLMWCSVCSHFKIFKIFFSYLKKCVECLRWVGVLLWYSTIRHFECFVVQAGNGMKSRKRNIAELMDIFLSQKFQLICIQGQNKNKK